MYLVLAARQCSHGALSQSVCVCCNRYWEIDPESTGEACRHHKPYRIEVIGVTCDPGLAVARGVWRKLRTGRSVRSATLLRSHRLFSEHYERTAHLVDVATLYHTGAPKSTLGKALFSRNCWQQQDLFTRLEAFVCDECQLHVCKSQHAPPSSAM